ncbi:MAG: oligosaccharide flippase family protein [Bacteroidaceae bacterium]|nr:oligosaccharide flippase family protein [Bacteroidaceae bacterium]
MKNISQVNDSQDNAYDHIVKYIGLFGGVQGATLLISIIRNKVAAYFLGASGIGLINIYNKVVTLINQATNLGISFSAVKHVAELNDMADEKRLKELVQTVRVWSLMTAVLGLFVGLMLSRWLSWWTFENYNYTHVFCILSLVVAIMAVTGGEMAILKGLKQLKKVALISLFAALLTLLVCVPFYCFWGIESVLWSLLVSNAVILALHLFYSSKVVPWSSTIISLRHIKSGFSMAKLGVAFVLAGILGQGADYLIIAFIQNNGGLESVGLYNAGYFLVANIGSLLFVAVEADYFPRLSSMGNDVKAMNETVNRQVEVCVLLMAPCLMLELLLIPFMLPLLYTAEFLQAAPMAVCGIFYLFFKAMTLPVAYLALAKGDSKTYLVAEFLYDIFIAVAIPVAFKYYGLMGVGVALSLAGVFDFLMILIYYGLKYDFKMALRPLKIYLFQFLLLILCVSSFALPVLWMRWGVIICALLCSIGVSYHYLGQEMEFVKRFTEKLKKKL